MRVALRIMEFNPWLRSPIKLARFVSLKHWMVGFSVLLSGCGLELGSNQCPDANGVFRRSAVNLDDADIHLISGNAYVVAGAPDEIYPIVQTSLSAQKVLDSTLLEVNRRSIDEAIGRADISGEITICIPSGELGLKLDTLSISNLRPLDDREMDSFIENAIAAQAVRYRRTQLLSAGMYAHRALVPRQAQSGR